MAHSKIRLYDITVTKLGGNVYEKSYGYCTIIRDKGTKTVEIKIDKEFLKELNPNEAPMYTKENSLYTYIPYEGDDFKFQSIRKYVKMWVSIHIYAITNKISPKNLFSLVLYGLKNRDFSPEVTLKKWEKISNEKIDNNLAIKLVEKAQEYESYDRIHDWIRNETNVGVSVQMPEI